jgi:hypothetical protein
MADKRKPAEEAASYRDPSEKAQLDNGSARSTIHMGQTYLTLLIAIYGIVAGFSLIAAAARLRSLAS